jgi:membrane protease YdiL (CAAX protease family)
MEGLDQKTDFESSSQVANEGYISALGISAVIYLAILFLGVITMPIDDNNLSFASVVALIFSAAYLMVRFPSVLSFQKPTLNFLIFAVITGAGMHYIPFRPGGLSLFASFLDYDIPKKALFIFFLTVGFPVIEEVYFRGLLLPLLARKVGTGAGAIVSMTVFTLYHFPRQDEIAFLLLSGGVFTWLAFKSRSVIPAILAHSVGNTCWLILALKSH